MANYYTEFSFLIEGITAEERAWLEALLAETDDEAPNAQLAPMLNDAECGAGFVTEFDDDDDTMWFYSDESGTPEDAANVVQAFLAQFRPSESFGFEWANTCSKPRTDAFGGGAVFITATEQRWMGSGRWLAEQS